MRMTVSGVFYVFSDSSWLYLLGKSSSIQLTVLKRACVWTPPPLFRGHFQAAVQCVVKWAVYWMNLIKCVVKIFLQLYNILSLLNSGFPTHRWMQCAFTVDSYWFQRISCAYCIFVYFIKPATSRFCYVKPLFYHVAVNSIKTLVVWIIIVNVYMACL